jgi:hypothetical protein
MMTETDPLSETLCSSDFVSEPFNLLLSALQSSLIDTSQSIWRQTVSVKRLQTTV